LSVISIRERCLGLRWRVVCPTTASRAGSGLERE
jgi:hypothetical protein